MENSENVVETTQGNIKIVKYNKPRRKNAIDVAMYLKVTTILNDAANDENIAVTVLTGTGDYYSSGNDIISTLETRINQPDYNLNSVLKDFIQAFITFPKLLIAIVNGPAIGIAATTLGLCDLVFAAENAFFYTPFTKLGIVAEGCSTFTFPKLMGSRKATEMLLFNHRMSAKEALECGFVNYLFKPEELQTVWEKITEVSKLPQQSITASKRLMRTNMQDLLLVNEREIEELDRIWSSEEGVNNFTNLLNANKSKL